MAQSIKRAVPVRRRLAWIDAQRLLDIQVVLIPPSYEGCNIVRSERNECVFPVAFGREKSAVRRALEQHDLIRPDAPIRERLAKIFRNGPEVFPHNTASVFHAG